MSDSLVVLSDTRSVTGKTLVLEDYSKHFTLCRSGIWVGQRLVFAETIILAYEHTEDSLHVGWSINGTTVIDPGYSSGTPPGGASCPGTPSVTYNCPKDGFFHEISFTSNPGDPHECLSLQVLYRGANDANKPASYGPFTTVCLSGAEIDWPAYKLAEERTCLAAWWERLKRLVQVAHVNPGDPVEWLANLAREEALRLHAGVETLEHLDAKAQPELAKAIRADLNGILQEQSLRTRIPGRE